MDKNRNLTRGQHHLPQFLLKGFASRSRNKEVFTWLFRKDGPVVEANVKGIAKVRDFYGQSAEYNIEQRLSVMEDAFARVVRRLRAGGGLEDKQLLCEFVASTQIRTSNLRMGVSEAMGTFTEEFGNALTTPEYQAQLLAHALSGVREKITAGELDHVLGPLSLPQREEFISEMTPRLRQCLSTLVQGTTRYLADRMPSLTEPGSFKDAQNKMLSENLAPKPRIAHLMELNWSVVECHAEPLILGDIGVVAGSGSGELMNILRHDPSLDSVYLPISVDRLLLGHRSGMPIASIAELNAASAELSREFFISASAGTHRHLQRRIGLKQMLTSPTEIRDIVGSAFDGLGAAPVPFEDK